MAKKKGKKVGLDAVLDEVVQIRHLLVLQLITSGVQAKDIAATLGVDKSVVSRMVASRKIKKTPG
jgi:predicted transcriptional regulator